MKPSSTQSDSSASEHAEGGLQLASQALKAYHARACGRKRGDLLWEGWVEFDSLDGELALQTSRETTQPNLAAVQYWATGLSHVFLEGALLRAVSTTATAS